jgi:hypothetical protein
VALRAANRRSSTDNLESRYSRDRRPSDRRDMLKAVAQAAKETRRGTSGPSG